MRFRVKEFKAFYQVAEQQGLLDQLSHIKKSGWVIFDLNQNQFKFHRKKESQIVEGNFKDIEKLFINTGEGIIEMDSMDQVLTTFEEWLMKHGNSVK